MRTGDSVSHKRLLGEYFYAEIYTVYIQDPTWQN